MPAGKLTAKRLRRVLAYDRHSGEFRWRVRLSNSVKIGDVAGNQMATGYIRIRIDGSEYLAHRLAWLYVTGCWPKAQIDHRDLKKNNNSIENLREASNALNHRNMGLRRNSTTGYKGVYRSGDRFQAQIRLYGKSTYIGTFDSAVEAHAAYIEKATAHFGEFARAA